MAWQGREVAPETACDAINGICAYLAQQQNQAEWVGETEQGHSMDDRDTRSVMRDNTVSGGTVHEDRQVT